VGFLYPRIDKIANLEYTYTYDGFDNVTEEKRNGETFKQYEYDSHNRLSKTTITVVVDGSVRSILFGKEQ